MRSLLIKIPVVAGISFCCAAELPVCEEFSGEPGVECVVEGERGVLTTYGEGGRTLEFWSGDRKAYVEVTGDSVWASSGVRVVSGAYDGDGAGFGLAVEAVLEDIGW